MLLAVVFTHAASVSAVPGNRTHEPIFLADYGNRSVVENSLFDVQRIKCESTWNRRQYCRVKTDNQVELVYQYSSAGCWENDTWGYDKNGVWVSNGCRAEFEVGKKGGLSTGAKVGIGVGVGVLAAAIIAASVNKNKDNNDEQDEYWDRDVISCKSDNKGYKSCPTGRNRNVELVRQTSNSDCQYGTSWGYTATNVWVNKGCGGNFQVHRY